MCFVFSIVQVVDHHGGLSMGKWDPSPICLTHESRSPSRKGILKFEWNGEKPKGVMGVDRIVFCKEKKWQNKTGPPVNSAALSGKLLENLMIFQGFIQIILKPPLGRSASSFLKWARKRPEKNPVPLRFVGSEELPANRRFRNPYDRG